ncbi:anthranilate synthase component 2/putative glutamine amidotransferase [Streptosporangium becharense]|uniref:Anthranilate synthase component 2/putative glutamine amidotransferase n=1 Tax=Streptosporangium becharense TaxID=1816182 RepID=A0A7W9IE61_9ACTN|nr:gamma-glutamyl-gamma-aminobutyrate hydrolase family protein [Streptosporangium becharense]MBB2910008.1 anthranilate synthase component 2/putative glutamine amidotransferase [Streptosporangium becharense]MBB5819037.1 anthranilate synthase component 2/putative glutamine amidotransferase [Streptosporangium becharense]
MSRPVIGITCYVEPARFTVWEMTAALLPYTYVEHVARVGGQPVILPPAGETGPLVERLDGLILAGGGDVGPERYGREPHERTGYVRPFRDDAELDLVRAALERGVPFLGVCRGMQILNVALGGSLHQHLPDVVGHHGHAPAPGRFGRMPVRTAAGSRLGEILGAETVDVAHYHHQAVERLGAGLTVTARAEDGTVEAVEVDGHPFALAVQWHPEADEESALFEALVRHTVPVAR